MHCTGALLARLLPVRSMQNDVPIASSANSVLHSGSLRAPPRRSTQEHEPDPPNRARFRRRPCRCETAPIVVRRSRPARRFRTRPTTPRSHASAPAESCGFRIGSEDIHEDIARLTPYGLNFLRDFGIDVREWEQRPESKTCIDWSERRHHLSGPLGVACCAV